MKSKNNKCLQNLAHMFKVHKFIENIPLYIRIENCYSASVKRITLLLDSFQQNAMIVIKQLVMVRHCCGNIWHTRNPYILLKYCELLECNIKLENIGMNEDDFNALSKKLTEKGMFCNQVEFFHKYLKAKLQFNRYLNAFLKSNSPYNFARGEQSKMPTSTQKILEFMLGRRLTSLKLPNMDLSLKLPNLDLNNIREILRKERSTLCCSYSCCGSCFQYFLVIMSFSIALLSSLIGAFSKDKEWVHLGVMLSMPGLLLACALKMIFNTDAYKSVTSKAEPPQR